MTPEWQPVAGLAGPVALGVAVPSQADVSDSGTRYEVPHLPHLPL